MSWRDNHDRFAAIANGNPQLEAALPISADIATLAGIGLGAVTAIESARPLETEWAGARRRSSIAKLRPKSPRKAGHPHAGGSRLNR